MTYFDTKTSQMDIIVIICKKNGFFGVILVKNRLFSDISLYFGSFFHEKFSDAEIFSQNPSNATELIKQQIFDVFIW